MNLKLILLSFLLFLAAPTIHAQTDLRKQADALVKKMTLEEKVGQMTQLTMAVFAQNGWANQDGAIDPAALKKAVVDYKVGSLLNTTAHALSRDTWEKVQRQIQDEAMKTRLKIPVIYGLDAIHGQTYTLESTLFPQNIGMAATRNTDLVKKAAEVTAKELRASGVRWNFAPVLDLGRQPLWSRFPETYGEDVWIARQMGVAAVTGLQEAGLNNPNGVAACLKHYLAYSAPRTGKDRTPSYVPEIELREYYLPPFRDAVKAGAVSVMVNSGEINGEPVHASKYLLTDVLRKELGFEGVIVTDWEDIIRLHTRHLVASTPREAVAMAINAGIDMSMVPGDYSFPDLLKEAVEKGEVKMARIDDAVRRILILKMQLGLFAQPYPEPAAAGLFGLPEYQDLALQAAREAMTLLKNKKDILPLSKQTKVLVAGPASQSIAALNGCWSYVWQGNQEQYYPANSKTIAQAVSDKIGAKNVILAGGPGFDHPSNYDIELLKSQAKNADVILLCLGENAYAESPGNTRDLALPANQTALAQAALLTGKPVILILAEGRPRFITEIEPGMQGILLTYWSGRKSAEAISDVLFGDYNPSGILPFSYPKSMGEIVMYDRKRTEDVREVFNENMDFSGYDPLYPFGHGLSYTQFSYSPLKLSANSFTGTEKLTIQVTVTNTGKRDGHHAVELYSRDHYASITPSMQRLRGFQKIFLKAGESKELSFTLDKNDLAFVNSKLQTIAEVGEFDVWVGTSKAVVSYR
ncbi:MAG: glycoside hydrolase family 3 C-terminal domain-containing protein [Chitinophagales bacterium]|nr:glycoside hydrolase family 3 C-terminal domain-containing protein [Chitinophagales bacterium]